jgi:hypothetical protein
MTWYWSGKHFLSTQNLKLIKIQQLAFLCARLVCQTNHTFISCGDTKMKMKILEQHHFHFDSKHTHTDSHMDSFLKRWMKSHQPVQRLVSRTCACVCVCTVYVCCSEILISLCIISYSQWKQENRQLFCYLELYYTQHTHIFLVPVYILKILVLKPHEFVCQIAHRVFVWNLP